MNRSQKTRTARALKHIMLAMCAMVFASTTVFAQSVKSDNIYAYTELPNRDQDYPLRVKDISVAEALRLFAKNLRIGLDLHEDVDEMLEVDIDGMLSRVDYLNELAFRYDFSWYYDGNVLRVAPVGGTETEIYPLQENSGEDVLSLLTSLGIYQPRFTHRTDARNQAVLVTGPRTYLDVVKKAVDAFESAKQAKITVLRGSGGATPKVLQALTNAEAGTSPATTEATQ